MEESERDKAAIAAVKVAAGWILGSCTAEQIAEALILDRAEVLAGRAEIARLQDAAQDCVRLVIDNAARFAADLEAERRAGAARVERIRAAIAEGATDEAERLALEVAFRVFDIEGPPLAPGAHAVCAVMLATRDALRAARADLADLRRGIIDLAARVEEAR